MRRFLALCIILYTGQQAFTQTQQQQGPTCAQTLRLARATYEQGRLQEIELQLKSCLESGFTKEEKQLKVEGYKILCLSYIYLEEAEKADDAMLNILLTDPYFQINPAVDPAEFVALYKTFRTDPILRAGIMLGANASFPNVTSSVKVAEGSSNYSQLIGIQIGAAVEKPISKKLTLAAELAFQQKRFELTQKTPRGNDLYNNLLATETQSWISFPLMVRYQVMKSKVNPFVSLGASADLNIGSNINLVLTRDEFAPVEEKSYSFSAQRNKFNISAVAGAGIKYAAAGGFIIGEVRFIYGITPVNTEEKALQNELAALDYGYGDSIFKLNSVSASLTYVYNIFNPKKLNRKK